MPKFTGIAIDNYKPDTERREIPDDGCAGLYLVVQPTGRKSFAVRYRFAGKSRKLTLQKGTTLAAARAASTAALHDVERGIDPSAVKRQQKRAQGLAAANTFRAVAESYLQREGKKKEGERLRSLDYQAGLLERLVYPAIGDMPIAGIKRSTIISLLDDIEDNSGPVMAQSVLACVRKLLNWYAVRDEDYRSPVIRGMSRIKPDERARSRVLSDDELRAVWKTADERPGPFSALVKLLLLTAARRAEAAGMTWQEIDGTDWVLPPKRHKTKTGLITPLSTAALAVIESQPRIEGNPFVFFHSSGTTVGSSRRKKMFDEASGVTGWTLHDLRRTARTLLSRAGVNADVGERCLGHKIRGVRGTYDRHKFHAEKKHAFEALAALIEKIVNPPAGNVTTLRRG
jgi:integrase